MNDVTPISRPTKAGTAWVLRRLGGMQHAYFTGSIHLVRKDDGLTVAVAQTSPEIVDAHAFELFQTAEFWSLAHRLYNDDAPQFTVCAVGGEA